MVSQGLAWTSQIKESQVQSDGGNQTDQTVMIVETNWTGLSQTGRTA